MEFRLLYFEGCPGWEKTKENLDEVLDEIGLKINYDTVNVTQNNLPDHFYGSPTINFRRSSSDEWKDLFGMTGESTWACRPYSHNGQRTQFIPKEMLTSRLEDVCK